METIRELLVRYFGVNVYPQGFTDKYEIVSLSSANEEKIKSTLKDWKQKGFTTKKKSYSDFTHIKGLKEKILKP